MTSAREEVVEQLLEAMATEAGTTAGDPALRLSVAFALGLPVEVLIHGGEMVRGDLTAIGDRCFEVDGAEFTVDDVAGVEL